MTGPGHTCWAKFKKHHEKEITLRKPDKLDRGRSHMANVNVMAQHFNLLKKNMTDLDLFKKLDQIFNCNESGIQLDARNGLVPPSLVYCFIFPVTPKKKTQSIRPIAKAQVLTSVEQQKIF